MFIVKEPVLTKEAQEIVDNVLKSPYMDLPFTRGSRKEKYLDDKGKVIILRYPEELEKAYQAGKSLVTG